MPFPGTKVVPEGWSRFHQPVATGGMNARCRIEDPAREVVQPLVDGVRPAPQRFVVAGGDQPLRCRIQRSASQPDMTAQADENSSQGTYLVQIDDPGLVTLPLIEEGFLVVVTAAMNDPHLIDAELVVTEAQSGSERFTRDLACLLNNQPGRP